MSRRQKNENVDLSVVLAVHNEERNLARCLDSVKDIAAEIVIVDGDSTDRTVSIAKQYEARVIKTTNKPIFHINKQMALEAARCNWILQLDADEMVDKHLKKAIQQVVTDLTENRNGFWVKRKNYFLGTFLKKGGQYPDRVIRLVRKGKAYFPQKSVHEQIKVKGEVGEINGHLLHYNAPTFSRYLTNANRYTTLTAVELKRRGVTLSLFNDLKYLFYLPTITFIKLFVRHRGYADGFPGFIFAIFSGIHHALAYMKLGDLYRYEHSD